MNRRTLGRPGLEVSALGLGCMGMSEFYGASDDTDSVRTLHRAIELEVDFLDTADMYGPHTDERRELGVGFVSYSPLGRGFLSAQLETGSLAANDYRRTLPRFDATNAEVNTVPLETLTEVARRKGATPAQVALAWVLHQGDDIVPIPGTRRRRRLEENTNAATVKLDADDERELRDAFHPDRIADERYPPSGMRATDA